MIQLYTVLSASLLAMWDLDYCLGKQTDNYFVSAFTLSVFAEKNGVMQNDEILLRSSTK